MKYVRIYVKIVKNAAATGSVRTDHLLGLLPGGRLSAPLTVAVAHAFRIRVFVLQGRMYPKKKEWRSSDTIYAAAREKKTHQLAVESGGAAVQLGIKARSPQGGVGCATVRTLGLEIARGTVVPAAAAVVGRDVGTVVDRSRTGSRARAVRTPSVGTLSCC